jgi:hypothetical protein
VVRHRAPRYDASALSTPPEAPTEFAYFFNTLGYEQTKTATLRDVGFPSDSGRFSGGGDMTAIGSNRTKIVRSRNWLRTKLHHHHSFVPS